MESILLFAQNAASGSAANQKTSSIQMIVLMVVLFALMYFMMIRPQKKRQKEEQEMRNALEIGDEIVTIGGIVGRVVTIRENDLIIETGADRNKMKIERWAINTNRTKNEQHQKEVEAAREAWSSLSQISKKKSQAALTARLLLKQKKINNKA